ncbi:protein of unknown function [Bradyrhizobium vignae]|uniref:Uncharacterized protein n=1 Tax=Bradyrhizobium vignae TaxID=1549949 RepID=A0A2U3Q4S2_9BRAD|nr:protein of unknown function [Bradyrhizobium vignae]
MSSTVQKSTTGRLQTNRDKVVIYHGEKSAFNTSGSLPHMRAERPLRITHSPWHVHERYSA